MSYFRFRTAALVTAVIFVTACSRQQTTGNADRTGDANRVATTDAQNDRDADINHLQQRLDAVDRKWADQEKKLEQERATATASLRTQVTQDLKNARQAIENLRTTTAANWWEREEDVLRQNTSELERDVRRFTGRPIRPDAQTKPKSTEQDTAFAASRDQFINDLQPRVDSMKKQLDRISAKGTENTERKDIRARVNKLSDDLAALRNASPDDWWKISRDRVSDYLDRLETSVGRLDDNKAKS
jgi:hypothetical protein